MGRTPSFSTIICYLDTAGVLTEQPQTAKLGRGSYTLTAGGLYVFELGGHDGTRVTAGAYWDAAIIITTMQMDRSVFGFREVGAGELYAAGTWVSSAKNTNMTVDTNGAAGVTVTNGVLTATGGAVGGAIFDTYSGARRHRLSVQVGATGGDIRVATWGKE